MYLLGFPNHSTKTSTGTTVVVQYCIRILHCTYSTTGTGTVVVLHHNIPTVFGFRDWGLRNTVWFLIYFTSLLVSTSTVPAVFGSDVHVTHMVLLL